MGSMATVAKVVVVPRNGYVNRLQAWASAANVARTWGAPLEVCWEAEAVAPADAHALFRSAGQGATFISSEELTQLLGSPHERLPRYLTQLSTGRLMILAGHDRGEQRFMADLESRKVDLADAVTVVFIAGGRFHVPGETDFTTKRRDFYLSVDWSDAIRERIDTVGANLAPYVGIHVRETDKAASAPTRRALEESIRAVSNRTGIHSVFVAADTADTRTRWVNRLKRCGEAPWFLESTSHDRGAVQAGVDALVEWNLLARATAMVYAEDSSFGHEAAICNVIPELGIGLTAPPWLRSTREVTRVLRSGLTYPVRRGWVGRQ